MAFTQTDLDTLNAAIATGTRSVRYGDKQVDYKTLDEMLRARQIIMAELGLLTVASKKFYARHNKGTDTL
jgi:hypothetical protein